MRASPRSPWRRSSAVRSPSCRSSSGASAASTCPSSSRSRARSDSIPERRSPIWSGVRSGGTRAPASVTRRPPRRVDAVASWSGGSSHRCSARLARGRATRGSRSSHTACPDRRNRRAATVGPDALRRSSPPRSDSSPLPHRPSQRLYASAGPFDLTYKNLYIEAWRTSPSRGSAAHWPRCAPSPPMRGGMRASNSGGSSRASIPTTGNRCRRSVQACARFGFTRPRAPRALHRHVCGSRVRAARLREADAKDAEARSGTSRRTACAPS